MNLNNKRKMYVQIDRETGNDEMFALLDEVNSDLILFQRKYMPAFEINSSSTFVI